MASAQPITATTRLKRDYLCMIKEPLSFAVARPVPENMLEWRYVLKGSPNTPYAGGYYHGTLLFPGDYPFKPPGVKMLTPNGRFKVNERLCISSISDYHPETWSPSNSVSTILTGLHSFMQEDTLTHGSIFETEAKRRQLARDSVNFNLSDMTFVELFPEIVEEMNKLKEQKAD